MIQADLDGINLAQKLVDEAHITIGRRDEGTKSTVQQPATSIDSVAGAPVPGQSLSQPAGAKPTPSAPININTATAAELETLPGVGPSLAARIVTDREKYGPYRTVG
jgi:competence protein ComEA